MRTVVQALRELLATRVVLDGALELREEDPYSTCPATKILGGGSAVTLRFKDWQYKPDLQIPTNLWLFPLLNSTNPQTPACRSCDYIIFYVSKENPGQEKLFVFLCELKSGAAKGASPQLRNGKLIADYLLAVTKLHGKVTAWPEEPHYRGIIFVGGYPGNKWATRSPARANYTPDQLCHDLQTTTVRPGPDYPLQYFCV